MPRGRREEGKKKRIRNLGVYKTGIMLYFISYFCQQRDTRYSILSTVVYWEYVQLGFIAAKSFGSWRDLERQ